MNVAIAGAHGKIAQLLTQKLVADGRTVVGLVRNPDHIADIEGLGATSVICDLETGSVADVAAALAGCDAVVFAAGAGAGSSAERKLTMDRDGAIKLLEATWTANIDRFIIISAVGAEDPPADDSVMSVYLRAKAEADEAVQNSDRRWTIIRPGGLVDEPGTGQVRIDIEPEHGHVTRDDVAAVVAATLADPRAEGKTLYVNEGHVPIGDALDLAFRPRPV